MRLWFWFGVCRALLDTLVMLDNMLMQTEDAVEVEAIQEIQKRLRRELRIAEKKRKRLGGL